MTIYRQWEGKVSMFAFRYMLVLYGVKIVDSKRRYMLELVFPLFDGTDLPYTFYNKQVKPLFRNLYLLNLLAIPVFIIYCAVFLLFIAVIAIINFPNQILIKQSFLSQKWEFVGGWLWIAFAIYGAIKLFI